MTHNKRIKWIDVTKGILICFIVLGHIISNDANILQTWIYSFHVAGFFIINGILKSKTNSTGVKISFKEIILRQRYIWVVYIFFSGIFLARILVQTYFGMYNADDIYTFLLHTIYFNGLGVLWFIPAFAIGELIFYNALLSRKHIIAYCIICGVTFILLTNYKFGDVLHTNNIIVLLLVLFMRSLIASSFMCIGYFFDKYKLIDGKLILIGVFSLLSYMNGNVDLNNMRFNNLFLYYLFSVLGTLFVISIAKCIEKFTTQLCSIFVFWGKNSLFIMVTHAILLIYQIVVFVLNKFPFYGWGRISLCFIITMLIETMLIFIYNHFKGKLIKNSQIYKEL